MNFQNNQQGVLERQDGLAKHIVFVYAWMFAGLMTTAGVALVVQAFLPSIFEALGGIAQIFMIVIIIVKLLLVLFLSSVYTKLSYHVAAAVFMLYSVLTGVVFSTVFYVYTGSSLVLAFAMAAAFFGVMVVYGLTTKKDLTSIGSLLLVGLISIIIMSIINIIIESSGLYILISFAGVAIFLGLTAYDNQKIKRMYQQFGGTEREKSVAIIGALGLYLDFINLFWYILRIVGRRN